MSIGSQLKKARQAKGISLKEASGRLKIPERFLEAIENDDIQALPNPVYAKWFVKTYAGFLGLNVNSVEEGLKKESGIKHVEQVIRLPKEELPVVGRERYFKHAMLAVFSALVFIGAAAFLFNAAKGILWHKKPAAAMTRQRKHTAAKPRQKPQPAVARRPARPEKTAPPSAAAPVSSKAVAAGRVEGPLNLLVTAKKPCRLSLKSDGRLLFDDFLLAGSAEKWQANTNFEMALSDCSAVEVALNKRRLKLFYKGAKSGIVITKDGIKR